MSAATTERGQALETLLETRSICGESHMGEPLTYGRPSTTLHRATWFVGVFVAWGAWNALTDCFPLNENQARPSWYLYGWPVCFATSGRGRLNLGPIDGPALLFDLLVLAAVVACTVFALETLMRRWPQFSVRDALAYMAGVAVMLLTWSGTFYWLIEFLLDSTPPLPGISAIEGNVRLTSRLPSVAVTFPLSLGLVAVGATIFKLPFFIFGRHRESADTG